MYVDRPDIFFHSMRYESVECPLHMHEHMEIVLVEEGVLRFRIADLVYAVEAGSAVFLSPFTPHAFLRLEGRCHVLMFSRMHSLFETFIGQYREGRPLFTPSLESRALADRLLPERENIGGLFAAQAVLGSLLYDVAEQCAFAPKKEGASDAFDAALKYIHEHFTSHIGLSEVAKAVGIHPVTLSRGFAEKTKINFTSYLNSLRCSHAAMLIQQSNKSLAEISFEAGFGSIRSFNRAFARIYGMSPSQYRSLRPEGEKTPP